ncbi:hypothetical protein [Nocardia sp. NPDC052566]|uniref:hypothetical protein n=1 Tax=Nocardia sp. NPDC052566 TaxID=3364330 RepID=UPI0037C91765
MSWIRSSGRGGATAERAVHAFDPNDYRKRVLAQVERRGGIEHSDPFELYDIPLDEAETLTDAEVAARIADVWGFWQRQRDHPKYRVLVGLLVDEHDELSRPLQHAGSRAAEAARIRTVRERRDAERYEMLDAAISRLVQRYGGIPAGKVSGLEEIGAMGGLSAAEVATRLRRHRVIADTPVQAPPPGVLSEQRRQQIRQLLTEWERLLEGPPTPTLFALLGMDPTQATHTGEIRLRAEALRGRSRELPPGRVRVVLDELLIHVHDLLEAGGPAVREYLRAIAADVADDLRPKVRAAVLVEDELVGDDFAYLVDEAVEAGLDRAEATRVVTELATELGARVDGGVQRSTGTTGSSGGATGGYGSGHGAAGTRGSTGSPSTGGRATGPSNAGGRTADSHSSGAQTTGGRATGSPSSQTAGGRSSGATGAPTHDAAAARRWEAPLKAARAALRAGHPREAERHVAEARRLATGGDGLTSIRSVADEVDRVLAEAAVRWRGATGAYEAKRYVEVLDHVAYLERTASDVPNPNGRGPGLEQMRTEATRASAEADRLVATAPAAPVEARLKALLAALAVCADHTTATTELAAVPVGAPARVDATRMANGSIRVTWSPSATASVDYRVTRLQPDGTWRVVGRTKSTELEDGGAPPTGQPVYAVVAGIAGRYSEPTRSDTTPATPAPGAGSSTTAQGTGASAGTRSRKGRTSLRGPDHGPTPASARPDHGAAPAQSSAAHGAIPPQSSPSHGTASAQSGAVFGASASAQSIPAHGAVPTQSGSVHGTASASSGPVHGTSSAQPGSVYGAASSQSGPVRGAASAQSHAGDGAAAAQARSEQGAGPALGRDEPLPNGIPVISGLAQRGDKLVFDWPSGLTEVMVVARVDAPPTVPADPRARAWKLTNTRYQIDGGLRLPADLSRPCHVAIASCRREPNGTLTVATAFAPTSRIHISR